MDENCDEKKRHTIVCKTCDVDDELRMVSIEVKTLNDSMFKSCYYKMFHKFSNSHTTDTKNNT